MSSGRNRTRHARPKTKTFTGCWTCRRRKLKCDCARPECGRCRRAGLSCEGYDLKLYWITDEDTVAPSAIKRQAMTLTGNIPPPATAAFARARARGLGTDRLIAADFRPWAFPLDEVDQQLADIDAAYEGASAGRTTVTTGPFSVFRARDPPVKTPDQVALEGDGATIEASDHLDYEILDHEYSDYEYVDGEDLTTITTSSSHDGRDWQLQPLSSRHSPPSSFLELNPALFQDPVVHRLMDNYVRNVANVLPPLPHPENPYSSIYVPKAMEGASDLLFGLTHPAGEIPSTNVAIFYALLATSAFHLRGSDAHADSGFDVVARKFRAKAFASLQVALQDPLKAEQERDSTLFKPSITSSSHCLDIISAMLTLITMDVMEGSMSEYWIHLDGVDRVARQLRRDPRDAARFDRLITISSFLSTVAKTTSTDLPAIPWSDDDLETLNLGYQSGIPYGLEFTYGITPTLSHLMSRIVTMSQHIAYYVSNALPFPRLLVSGCVNLLNTLSNWSIDSEPLSGLFDGTGTSIGLVLAKNHVLAFAHGLRVYYHTRVLPCTPVEMAGFVDRVAQRLTDIEEIKRHAGYDSNIAATITWPGFIASCEAEHGPARAVWYRWWSVMLTYRIGNIGQLWKVVQEAWRLKDEEGLSEVPAWVPVLRRSGKKVLAI